MEIAVGYSAKNTAFITDTTQAPATNDAATAAAFKIIAGERDPNGGGLEVLHDGKIPRSSDDPRSNFFFERSGSGGRILVDLGKMTALRSIATYSWHVSDRAAQNYDVFGADGTAPNIKEEPPSGTGPSQAGWELLATIDTAGQEPGQHAVVLSGKGALPIGTYRYLLFDIRENDPEKVFSDTFFSEIDIEAAGGSDLERLEPPKVIQQEFASDHGNFSYLLDVTEAPDLQKWCGEHLVPVMDEWYPKIIAMLPVEGVSPAEDITFTIRESTSLPAHLRGVPAFASGKSVVFNAGFMRRERSGEAVGAGVHEVVHVVQFGGDSTVERTGPRPPSWVTEGVADYIRWFLYEPESKGAEITPGNFANARYDSSYRITANFFNFVIENYENDLIRKLNVATHQGYTDALWQEWTGKSVQALGDEWKEFHRKKLGL